MTPRFLSAQDVLRLHAITIEDQGGDPSIRDRALLDAAVAMPAQQYGGQYLHEDIPAMAAAYAFHICKNHPFVDGNKRAGTAAMIAFLVDNGWVFEATADEAEPVILRLAAGELDKDAFAAWASGHMREKPKMELREFFAEVRMPAIQGHYASVLAGMKHGTPAEVLATHVEVAKAIPLYMDYARAASECLNAGDREGFDEFCRLFSFLAALYRVAEEMGYEW
jgi:death on curing protein